LNFSTLYFVEAISKPTRK